MQDIQAIVRETIDSGRYRERLSSRRHSRMSSNPEPVAGVHFAPNPTVAKSEKAFE
jgi:hypothetical protein